MQIARDTYYEMVVISIQCDCPKVSTGLIWINIDR